MKNQNRSGFTLITSASLSKEFNDLIEKYDISPTEAMRRGVAVMLCDLGVKGYTTKINQERLKYVKKFMLEIESKEKLKKIKELLE